MQIDYLSTGIGMIVGAVLGVGTGITIEYYSNILTDRRRQNEKQKAEDEEFAKIAEQMPELLQEMKEDIILYPDRRDFLVIKEGVSIAIYDGPTLEYKEEAHPEINGKMSILENHGYIFGITKSDVPEYRMTEHFVKYLLKGDLPAISMRSIEEK